MKAVGVWASLVVLMACHDAASTRPGDASTTPSVGDATVASPDASGDATASDADDDAGDPQPWGPDPPATPCLVDAAVPCRQAPSVCSDSRWLVAYPAGLCVGGSCQWKKNDIDCMTAGATCGTAPADAGTGADAQVAFLSVGPVGGSGCIVPAPPGPDPSPMACDVDAAADAAVCALPPSVCADGTDDHWLVYYDNGQCVAGQCAWQKLRTYCAYGCDSGGCLGRPTVPSPAISP
jgi:hypothetical protein